MFPSAGRRGFRIAGILLIVLLGAFMLLRIFPTDALAVDPNEREFTPSATGGNHYNLPNLHTVPRGPVGDYVHTQWGVYEWTEQLDLTDYYYAGFPLHKPAPYYRLEWGKWIDDPGTELFVSDNLFGLNHLPFNALQGVWEDGEAKGIVLYDNPGDYYLFRKLRFHEHPFTDRYGNTTLYSKLRSSNLIILIHGWNRVENDNANGQGEFKALSEELDKAVDDGDWDVIQYHWEADAATGDLEFDSSRGPFDASFVNGIEAAEYAFQHGVHLADILNRRFPKLERVHLIAHSAGSWAARSAAYRLLQQSGTTTIQVTLLDAFIPGDEDSEDIADSTLSEGFMTQMGGWAIQNPLRIFLLENYYAIDGSDLYWEATSGAFQWRSEDVNREISWIDYYFPPAGAPILTPHYVSHSGPIQWYADTVKNPSADPEGIDSCPGRG